MVFRYYSVFKASKPLASRRSRTGDRPPRATKNPLGEWASGIFPACREVTLSHRLGCQIASGHWLRDYSTLSAPVKGPTRLFCATSPFSRRPNEPSPLGGAIRLSCVEPCDSHRPGRYRAASDVGEGYCSAVWMSVKRLAEKYPEKPYSRRLRAGDQPDVATLTYLEDLTFQIRDR